MAERLRAMPALVVTGPRQAGKSTLAQQLAPGKRRYRTLDDLDVLDAAHRDPEALLGGNEPLTLDEVQRAPDLLHAVKRAIDQRRVAGRFLLTGSANLLMMRQLSESLAGRASYLTLWPMTRREQRGEGRAGLWGELLATPEAKWLDLLASQNYVKWPVYRFFKFPGKVLLGTATAPRSARRTSQRTPPTATPPSSRTSTATRARTSSG